MSETSAGPLRVRSVVGLAYDELRAMIVEGRLGPGSRIGQAEVADMLGISRGSVREALRRLAGDGLVEFEVNRGFFVADLGLDRVLERLEARLQLEPETPGSPQSDGARTTSIRCVRRSRPRHRRRPHPARVLLQDFTGVPAVVDLAAMRERSPTLGGDPEG